MKGRDYHALIKKKNLVKKENEIESEKKKFKLQI